MVKDIMWSEACKVLCANCWRCWDGWSWLNNSRAIQISNVSIYLLKNQKTLTLKKGLKFMDSDWRIKGDQKIKNQQCFIWIDWRMRQRWSCRRGLDLIQESTVIKESKTSNVLPYIDLRIKKHWHWGKALWLFFHIDSRIKNTDVEVRPSILI